MRYLLLIIGALFAGPALAQEVPAQSIGGPTGRIVATLHANGVINAWGQSVRDAAEPVETEVVLALRTDSTGSIESVEVASAPRVNAEVREQIVALVEPMVLPELRSYDGPITFTLRYEPEERTLSPVMVGVLAGLTVGVTALLLALLE